MISTEEQRKLDKELFTECRGYGIRDNKPDGAYIKVKGIFFNLNKIKRLIEAGADVNAKDDEGRLPLHWAVSLGNKVALAKLLISAGANVNAKSNIGWSPLAWAVDRDSVAIVKRLISAGADVNTKDNMGQSPLHRARSVTIAELLISAGAKVNSKDNVGRSPLHFRVVSEEMQDLLKQHGAI